MQPYSIQVLDAALLPVYNYHITATMDAAKLNSSVGCRQIVEVLDDAAISASKVFQVPAIIIIKQK